MLDIAEGRSAPMKCFIATAGVVFSVIASDGASAEPVLMLNEPRDISMAQYSCDWAESEIKRDQYLIKSFQCSESDLCQRAVDINAACRASGPVAEVRAFHSKLLAQFSSNASCAITIMRLSGDTSNAAIKKNLDAQTRANWMLDLSFTPGATKQGWALWPSLSGQIITSGVLEGEGAPGQIARDVCTIMTRGGAKIFN
jgi:hypothetical protein